MSPAHTDILVLGPLQVHVDGATRPLVRRKQRALLALLVSEPNRVVSADRIVDELWPESPPAGAQHSVEVYVSALRKLLGETRIARRDGGYQVRLEPGELDAERFAALLAQARAARPGRARRLLEQALALVRGEPLAGLDELAFVRAERARLQELVTAAREALAETRLALGEHEALIPELRASAAAEPTRERTRAQLMLALYRAGRHEEALAEYRAAHRILREERGLEPGPELHDLERRILHHDPSLVTRGGAPPPSNLPAPMHPLIGRRRELEEVADLLRADARLVTVTGPPGVGKTRLAIALGHAVLPEFTDGVFLVELAPLRDPALVVSALARTLEVPDTTDEPVEAVVHHLEQREILLVVDNLEHLLDAAALLTRLLASCPDLRIVVTSRTALSVYGEHRYPLEPLGVAAAGSGTEEIAAAPAVALFAARARAVRPGFDVTDENAATTAAICRRLDGLPLAIELAASRTALLAPPLLLERLAKRLDAGRGPRDAPDRHRTLRSTLEWSYDLLGPDEQAIFRRLGVFAGGFVREAAEQVTEGAADPSVESLVAHNLVRHAAKDRYDLLETVREYALEKLAEAGEDRRIRERHCLHLVELAEAAEPELYAEQSPELLARLDAEYANILAAARYAAELERGDLELRLLGRLLSYFGLRGLHREGRDLLDAALARNPDQPVALRARVVVAAASLAVFAGELEYAHARAREALRLAEEAGDASVRFLALDALAFIAYQRGEPGQARALSRDALAVARETGEAWIVGTALNNYGASLMASDAMDEAQVILGEGLVHQEQTGNANGIASAHASLGIIAVAQSRHADAVRHLAESLAHSRDRNAGLVFDTIVHLAELAASMGEARAAARLLGTLEQRPSFTDRMIERFETEAAERASAAVRSRLGAGDIERARAEGRELAYEEIVDYALAVTRACARKAGSRVVARGR